MSHLARTLIAENKRTRTSFLDLGNCDLRKIPPEIAELVWLESLSLAGEWHEWDKDYRWVRQTTNSGARNGDLVDIAPLSSLSGLHTLVLSDTQVASLEPLSNLIDLHTLDISGTPVTDLRPLSNLSKLQTLNVSGTRVSDLGPLSDLTGLQRLDVTRTPVADLRPLSGLTALQWLDATRTPVADLEPLADLSELQTLQISDTQVAKLGPLAGLSRLRTLEAYDTQVTDLGPLAGLTGLRRLVVSDTPVTSLEPLASVASLQWLDLKRTAVADLGPLSGLRELRTLVASKTPVVSLRPLAGLTGLQTLVVSDTAVASLRPLSGLAGLQKLVVSNTEVADLGPLAGLTGLKRLVLSDTAVADLGPLAGLTGLEELFASGTLVADLGPLAKLSGLRTLFLFGTQVADLEPLRSLIARGSPVHWSSNYWGKRGIYVRECPLLNPPEEIVSQGNEAILNYFREQDSGGVDHLYEAKMLILGEGGAGKTSLLRRLYQPDQPLPAEHETTKGISIYTHEFLLNNGRRFRLNVWDFGGQEIYHATHQFFLTRRSLYLLVDDTRKDHKSVSDDGFKYWLELIDLFGGHSPVLIFQNEKGGRSKAIDLAGIKGRYDNVKERYAGNLQHGNAAEHLRDGIEFYVSGLSHIGEQLPARWIKLRLDIEERARRAPYITQQEYFDVYSRHMEFDRSKALHLSRYLHDLGVFLHFQDDSLLARTVILQNTWATEAVFRILDDELVKGHSGRFNHSDCERLWRDSAYADMHPELLALMQRFELCYVLADSRPQTWLAPQLLPPAKPSALAGWGAPDKLVLRYRYEFMPKGIISRLTVRLHRFVRDPEMAWITGVLFERDATAVLVELLASGREIELRALGPERKALLSVVAADLDALNESFQGLRYKVDKRIPCHCKSCSGMSVPHFFAEKNLLNRKDKLVRKVQCENSFEAMDVLELLDGIRVDKLPAWGRVEKPTAPHRTVQIFLASSSELWEDRNALDLFFRQQNDHFLTKGIYLKIVRWENFLDAMSETRLQDEYNKVLSACDIFVSLFFTRTGRFSEEEFHTANRRFQDTGRPLIYTFFKNADIKTGSALKHDLNSLWAFQEKLAGLGHFYTMYDDIEHLKRQFRDQLDKLFDSYL